MNNRELRDAERKAGFIDRNAGLYGTDPDFKRMVDQTVYLSQDEIQKSQTAVVTKFGTRWEEFRRQVPNA